MVKQLSLEVDGAETFNVPTLAVHMADDCTTVTITASIDTLKVEALMQGQLLNQFSSTQKNFKNTERNFLKKALENPPTLTHNHIMSI